MNKKVAQNAKESVFYVFDVYEDELLEDVRVGKLIAKTGDEASWWAKQHDYVLYDGEEMSEVEVKEVFGLRSVKNLTFIQQ